VCGYASGPTPIDFLPTSSLQVRQVVGVPRLYSLTFAEAARVLRTGGRLVVLSPCKQALHQALASTAPLWRVLRTATINCGGCLAIVLVCSRTGEPFERHWDRVRRRPLQHAAA